MCFLRASLVGHTLEQVAHWTPPLSTCLDSMWCFTWLRFLDEKEHWRHIQNPVVDFSMFLAMISSRPKRNSYLLLCFLWLCMVRAFLVGQTMAHTGHMNPPLSMCLDSTWALTWWRCLELKSHWWQCHRPMSSLAMYCAMRSSSPAEKEYSSSRFI